MATIVEYTDRKVSQNRYPTKIISPSRSGPCCYAAMEDIGRSQEAEQECRYKGCQTRGFTARVILRARPDVALIARLRKTLARALHRKVPC